MLLLDAGRLMASPLSGRTRLDVAVDAAVAVALVADVLGDRAGTLAFDRQVRRQLAPRRAGAARSCARCSTSSRAPRSRLRARVPQRRGRQAVAGLIFCDLLEETAARPGRRRPGSRRRHAVTVATVRDPDLDAVLTAEPAGVHGVSAQAVALDVLAARNRVGHMLRRAGAQVVEAPAERLAAACVTAYLRAKTRGRA